MEVPLTPLEFARRARKLYPKREALIDGKMRLSYEQFFDRCDRWSAALQNFGIQKGDRVAYIAPNTHAQLESFYAVPSIGAVLVPVNYRLIADDFVYLLNHSGSRVVCAHSAYLDAVDSIRSQLTTVKYFVALEGAREGWIDYEKILANSPNYFKPCEINESDLITINYTSGTTSRPKGVMITHRNAYMNSIGTLVHCHMTCGDRYLWTLPMFHANGWTFVWTVTAVGATHICLRSVQPDLVFDAIQQENITMFCAAPTVLISIASAPQELRHNAPRGLRILTAGAPPAAATIERIENDLGWHITHVYGLTETAPFITVCEPRPEHDQNSQHDRATIKARQGVELITSGDLCVFGDDGNEVPHDGTTMGQIAVRGNVVMKGYFEDPEATSKAIRNGWFFSGDAAVVHPDGYVEIRDRLKDVIISGGENVSSVEVEGVLLRHPAIQEVGVVGLPHERWGEAVYAFVVLRSNMSATEEEIIEFARSKMAHFKAPKGVTFLPELPKTATGKVQKYLLRGGKAAIVKQ
ncbi:MAG TPA: long-chain-fatty-acid--CoA ligase [Acidobacteriota bacterium]|nr:long-chain-fatty-acid--CoA ligase [Acidobacteriota bacterium]